MRAEQGPLWGCDPEWAPRADDVRLSCASWFRGEEAA